jgi:hypothetical protein
VTCASSQAAPRLPEWGPPLGQKQSPCSVLGMYICAAMHTGSVLRDPAILEQAILVKQNSPASDCSPTDTQEFRRLLLGVCSCWAMAQLVVTDTMTLLLLCCPTAGSLQLRVSPSKTPVRSDRDAERTGRGGGGGSGSGSQSSNTAQPPPDVLHSSREGAGAGSADGAAAAAAAGAGSGAADGLAQAEPLVTEAPPTSPPAAGAVMAEASGVGAMAGVVAGAPGLVDGAGGQEQGEAPNAPAAHIVAPGASEGLVAASPTCN